MENLWLFTNLTKLQMDNNIIEKIEGLDTLTKLTWLGKFFLKNKISFENFIF
jgi:Leucine-rich repeat (LRR) protein